MQNAIKALVDQGSLTPEQATAALEIIMSGEATPAQVGAFLAAWRIRGESPEVVAACIGVIERHAEQVPASNVIDVCGTGGDGIDTFNVSTAAGLVAAAAGARVAKHGNRAASSKCGSADLLEALGANLQLGGAQVARVIDDCGFSFLFAQRFHPAMRHVGGPRRELGIRTAFNLLGPLSNPAKPKRQLVGVGARALGPLVAQALALRGMERAIVVHSADGLDEISPTGVTYAWMVGEGAVAEQQIRPADFDLPEHPLERVLGGDPEHNAGLLQAVVDGAEGPVTDFVVMNASAALFAAGLATDFPAGTELAREAIASGRAREVLDRYVALSQELAGE